MSKLISNPTECGYRVHELEACTHKKYNSQHCPSCFPTNCPLQDGIPKEPIPDSVDLTKFGMKPKRRNRKDCVHCFGWAYKSNAYGSCFINNPRYLINKEHKCSGVNCGRFETKKK